MFLTNRPSSSTDLTFLVESTLVTPSSTLNSDSSEFEVLEGVFPCSLSVTVLSVMLTKVRFNSSSSASSSVLSTEVDLTDWDLNPSPLHSLGSTEGPSDSTPSGVVSSGTMLSVFFTKSSEVDLSVPLLNNSLHLPGPSELLSSTMLVEMLAVVTDGSVLTTIGVSSAKDDSRCSQSSPLFPSEFSEVTHMPLISADSVMILSVTLSSPSLTDSVPSSLGDPDPVIVMSSANSVFVSTPFAVFSHFTLGSPSSTTKSVLVEKKVCRRGRTTNFNLLG